MLEWVDLQETNGNLKDARDGLPVILAKTRVCLKCGQSFFSGGPQVRKCLECKRKELYNEYSKA
jgi:tRNA(Ile2) C34 agmatinyltransferase TiaS